MPALPYPAVVGEIVLVSCIHPRRREGTRSRWRRTLRGRRPGDLSAEERRGDGGVNFVRESSLSSPVFLAHSSGTGSANHDSQFFVLAATHARVVLAIERPPPEISHLKIAGLQADPWKSLSLRHSTLYVTGELIEMIAGWMMLNGASAGSH